MYGIKETAELLNISPITVRRRIKDKKIRAYKEGKWKVSSEEIERQLAIRQAISITGMPFIQASKLIDLLKYENDKKIEEENKTIRESFMNNIVNYLTLKDMNSNDNNNILNSLLKVNK